MTIPSELIVDGKVDTDELRRRKDLREDWYYTMELAPDVFTAGRDYRSVALTRRMLRSIDVEGRSCLDIGAMEGLVSALLCRRGAGRVVSYDRAAKLDRIGLVKACLGLDFEYLSRFKLGLLRERLHGEVFDVVIFSGVLYHMFDPMAGLAIVRGLVRDGGVVVLETSAVVEDDLVMHLNARGRFFPWTNYWQVNVGCLNYLLRFMRLEPIDLSFFDARTREPDAPRLCRVAVTCRATRDVPGLPEDEWVRLERAKDFFEFLDWKAVRSDEEPVPVVSTALAQSGFDFDDSWARQMTPDRASPTSQVDTILRLGDLA